MDILNKLGELLYSIPELNLINANLIDAYLRNADLRDADLRDANLMTFHLFRYTWYIRPNHIQAGCINLKPYTQEALKKKLPIEITETQFKLITQLIDINFKLLETKGAK